MRIVITIEVCEALEEGGVLEEIEALLDTCGAAYTWEDRDE